MAVRKSTRIKSGLGGRPRGSGVRHTTSHVQQDSDIEERTPDEIIHHNEEIEDDIRETIRVALVENQSKLAQSLARVAEDDPKAFLSAYKDYAEFILPKLQRTDSKLDSSNPLELKFESIEDYQKRKEREKQQEEDKKPKKELNDFPTNN